MLYIDYRKVKKKDPVEGGEEEGLILKASIFLDLSQIVNCKTKWPCNILAFIKTVISINFPQCNYDFSLNYVHIIIIMYVFHQIYSPVM